MTRFDSTASHLAAAGSGGNGGKPAVVTRIYEPEERGGRRECVLVVEDEGAVRMALTRALEKSGYGCATAPSAERAHVLLDHQPFDLALCDLGLPGESGLDLVDHLLFEHPSVATVVSTGRDDPALAENLFALGAYGYLVKPFTPSQLVIEVASALTRRREEAEFRSERERLQQASAERGADLLAAVADLDRIDAERQTAVEDTITCLARAVELRDGGLPEHSDYFGARCAQLAEALGLEPDHCERIRLASQLHDVGKLAIPENVLRKPGRLTTAERAVVEEHPLLGYRILASSRLELLRLGATIALGHHERFDGLGYPNGLAGKAIPLEARIVSVVDVFDALTADRPYREALEVREALQIMRDQRGGAFDPEILDTFVTLVETKPEQSTRL